MDTNSEIKTLSEKLDTVIEKLNNMQDVMVKLSQFLNEREDLLMKGKDTINNIHRTFGSNIDIKGIFNNILSLESDEYCNESDEPVLALEYRNKKNPFD